MTSSIQSHPEIASNIKLLEAWIESHMAYRDLPGMSIGVVYDQELIRSRGFGYADREKEVPAAPNTIYRVGSITKLFTATAIMQLRDQGKLQLDNPINKYLPWFNIQASDPDAPAITIRHLLTHTSGLPREAAFPYWTDDHFPTLEQIQDKLPEQRTVLAPETRWMYSNLAFALAGEIVSVTSKKPFPDYIHQRILEPLRMTSSSVILPDDHRSRLATGYGRRIPGRTREIAPFTDAKGLTAAGGMSSTLEDLTRFLSFQLHDGQGLGEKILKRRTLREMHRVHWLDPDWTRGWGLGFIVRRQEKRVLVEMGGQVLGYQGWMAVSPEEKLGIIALTNADDVHPLMFIDKAFALLALPVSKMMIPAPKVPLPDPESNRYVGKYRNRWGDLQVLLFNGELVMISPTGPDPQASMAKLVPQGEHRFMMTSKDGFTGIAELVFELGPNGKVIRLKIGEDSAYPHE